MRLSTMIAVAALLAGGTSAASAASVTKTADVTGTPDQIWAAIGPFCSIQDWHPAIGKCTTDGKTPPTRTLVTKDGKATFVELQTARDDKGYSYSYAIKTSPLPLTDYVSTIKVAAKGKDMSTITWNSTFTPASGKEAAASDAVGGIYQSGLDAVKSKMAK
jgi:hypothetical protein